MPPIPDNDPGLSSKHKESPMDIDLVVFDMAGTTVRDDDAVNRCFRDAIAGAAIDVSRDEVNAVMGIAKPVAIRTLLERAGRTDPADLDAEVRRIHADFVRRMVEHYRDGQAVAEVPGASDVFRALRAAGVRVALNTGFSRQIASVLLERLGWAAGDTIDAVVTSDEVDAGRPAPDMIRLAMRRAGVSDPRRVAKVGDTPADLEEGDHAGCGRVIGVTASGSHTRDQLRPHPHTDLIDSVADLPALLLGEPLTAR